MVRLQLSSLEEGRWYEYVIRFVLGGVTTLVAGLLADYWGPQPAGYFWPFPPSFARAPHWSRRTNGAKNANAMWKGTAAGLMLPALKPRERC